jgi:nitroreductase
MIEAINFRKSIRNYKEGSLSPEDLQKIKIIINEVKPLYENIPMETFLIEDGEKIQDAFKGFIAKYTKVKAPHYIAFTSEIIEGHLENIGFIGEEIVLKLTQLGIGTCWLGSPINQDQFKSIVKVQDKQNFIILVALGYPDKQLKLVDNRKRLDINKIITGIYDIQYTPIIQALIDAPSAINSQPTKLSIDNNKFDLYLENKNVITKTMLKDTNRIDVGIALNHLYNSAVELGYFVELKQTPHKKLGSSHYIISAILDKI